MSERICTFPCCTKNQVARSLCNGHYKQLKKGKALEPLRDPWVDPKKLDSQTKRLLPLGFRLESGSVVTESGCREWVGATTEHGYGRMSYSGSVYRVHRLAAHLWLGLDLEDSAIKVCHHCDNPPCLNPDHLYLGDQKTNVGDMVERNRNYPGPDRWTHCSKGHAITPENTVGIKKPRCRICSNEQQNRRRREKQAVQAITEHLGPTP